MNIVELIATEQGFTLFADCAIEYDGRAYGTLERGNYLILYKSDGTLAIHGGELIPPRNYLGSKTKLTVTDNQITGKLKKESLTITIHQVYHLNKLDNWSIAKVAISKTEAELVEKLKRQWLTYFDVPCQTIIPEVPTPMGPIDLVGYQDNGTYHVVEVKRKQVTLAHCSQLMRYIEHFKDKQITTVGYMASPAIGANALRYLKKHDLYWIDIQF